MDLWPGKLDGKFKQCAEYEDVILAPLAFLGTRVRQFDDRLNLFNRIMAMEALYLGNSDFDLEGFHLPIAVVTSAETSSIGGALYLYFICLLVSMQVVYAG